MNKVVFESRTVVIRWVAICHGDPVYELEDRASGDVHPAMVNADFASMPAMLTATGCHLLTSLAFSAIIAHGRPISRHSMRSWRSKMRCKRFSRLWDKAEERFFQSPRGSAARTAAQRCLDALEAGCSVEAAEALLSQAKTI